MSLLCNLVLFNTFLLLQSFYTFSYFYESWGREPLSLGGPSPHSLGELTPRKSYIDLASYPERQGYYPAHFFPCVASCVQTDPSFTITYTGKCVECSEDDDSEGKKNTHAAMHALRDRLSLMMMKKGLQQETSACVSGCGVTKSFFLF